MSFRFTLWHKRLPESKRVSKIQFQIIHLERVFSQTNSTFLAIKRTKAHVCQFFAFWHRSLPENKWRQWRPILATRGYSRGFLCAFPLLRKYLLEMIDCFIISLYNSTLILNTQVFTCQILYPKIQDFSTNLRLSQYNVEFISFMLKNLSY
jgi:hypothetical protein